MIIAIPFIYFSLLTLWLYKHCHQINIPVVISSMYAVCGFFSILVEVFDLRYGDNLSYDITPYASFAYCGLLTLTMLPLIAFPQPDLRKLKPFKSEKLLRLLAYLGVIWFVASSLFQYESIMRVLSGDMGELRSDVYKGDFGEDWMLKIPIPVRYLYTIIRLVVGCPWTMIFLAFFSRCVQKMPAKFFYMYLFVSLSGPFNGIIGADRSASAYWILSFFTIFLLFRGIMSVPDKKNVKKIGLFFVALIGAYLMAMTISRFGRDVSSSGMTGSQSSLISYFGQNYINFCYYFENYEPPFPHLGILFPFTSQFIFGVASGGTVIQMEMNMLTGCTTGVFYTFIGQIIIAAGTTVAISYCVVISLFGMFSLRRANNKVKLSASTLYLYYAIASVMILGPFVHYYSTFYLTTSLVMIYLFLRIQKCQK